MDIIIEPQRQRRRLRPFSISVGFSDTVLNIKERVQQYQGIPVPVQTLVFNGQVLEDDRHAATCGIRQNSHIQIKLFEGRFPPMKIALNITLPFSAITVPIQMDINDSILTFKERIIQMVMLDHPELTILSIRLHSGSTGAELHDHGLLGDYFDELVMSNSATYANIIASPSVPLNKLHLVLSSLCRTRAAVVEVNAWDNVEVLRNQLLNLNLSAGFPLPLGGYFFSHNQNLMREHRSFHWHNVRDGDAIQMTSAFVPGLGGGGGGGSSSMQLGGWP